MGKHNGQVVVDDPVHQQLLREIARLKQEKHEMAQALTYATGRNEFLATLAQALLARMPKPEDVETPTTIVTGAELDAAKAGALHIVPGPVEVGGHGVYLCITDEEIAAAQKREAARQAALRGSAAAHAEHKKGLVLV